MLDSLVVRGTCPLCAACRKEIAYTSAFKQYASYQIRKMVAMYLVLARRFYNKAVTSDIDKGGFQRSSFI